MHFANHFGRKLIHDEHFIVAKGPRNGGEGAWLFDGSGGIFKRGHIVWKRRIIFQRRRHIVFQRRLHLQPWESSESFFVTFLFF